MDLAELKSIDHLVADDKAKGIFRVHRSAFTDAAICEMERRRVFERCWLYLAHVSEVPKPGNFLTRMVGGKPLILARGKDGKLAALYNTCAHRGAMVCREKKGEARAFTCGYHGWSYDLKGKLIAQAGKESYTPDACANGAFNLVPVPKLAEFRGFLFVHFDAGAEPLEDYLAGACEYLDLVASASAQEMIVVGGTHEYACRANWKLLYENSADGYHAVATHSTYFDYLKARDKDKAETFVPTQLFGRVLNLGRGHAVSESQGSYSWGRPVARWIPEWGDEGKAYIEAKKQELVTRLGQEKGMKVAESDRNLLIFPNLVVNDIMAVTIRTFYPEAAGYMKINAWALAPKEEEGVFLDRRLRNFLEFLGPAGFATPDDVEMLELCQIGYQNQAGASWNDISRGMATEDGHAAKQDELQMRTFWRRWRELMSKP
jgi:p-cumate 2,3-dioxygenase alpha subunit